MRKFFTVLVLLSALRLAAQDKTVTYYEDAASNPPELAVTLTHINAEIGFVPEDNIVRGTVTFDFYPNSSTTDSITFSTPDFKIFSVTDGKNDLPWHQTGSSLVIVPPAGLLSYHKPSVVTIRYEAKPLKGAIYFVGWRPADEGKRKVIWAHRPMGWLPYMDARITMDMFYTFSNEYNVFANGERVEVRKNGNGTSTWHYRMAKNHPFFSTSVVIGDYDYKSDVSKGGVPLEYWYYRGEEAKVATTYQYTANMMDFFEKELGFKYPYPLYRQAPVIDYMYGAMETTTATVFGDFMLIDPHAFWQRNYINTNAHEMAHQWFGNYICQFVNKDVWLTESFGTYYAKMFEKDQFGEDHYQFLRNEEYNTVMQAAKTNNYPVGSSKGGVARIYQKGSLVLDMLRDVMGDTEFRTAVTAYLTAHPYKNAMQEDFFRSVYEATGNSYQWFFDEWILRGGEPNFRIEWTVEDDTTGKRSTVVHVSQEQEVNDLMKLFRMPVEIQAFYSDGTYDNMQTLISEKYHEFKIPNPGKKKVSFVLFDPGRKILKKLTFERSYEELASQLSLARNMIDRYDALLAMRNIPLEKKKNLLLDRWQKEKFHMMKSEIIFQLSADRSPECIAIYRQALNDSDALIRKAVLQNVVPAPQSMKQDFVAALTDFSYLNQELALQNVVLSFPEETSQWLEKTKDLKGWRGMNIRMRWLYLAVKSGKTENLQELIDYTGEKYEFETRINAFSYLKKLMYSDELTMKNATAASNHWNNKLSSAARDYLKYFNQEQ